MTQDIFKRFVQLIEFDQSLQSVEKELIVVTTLISEIKKQIALLIIDYEEKKINLHNLHKEVDQEELMMKTYDQNEQLSRTRLDAASSSKEYQALKKENDVHKKIQHAHEQVLMNVWNAFETGQKQFKETQEVFNLKKEQLEKDLIVQEEKIAELKSKIAQHEKERQSYLKDVPEEWINKYNRMRSTVKNPVVGIVAGTCGGCSYLLSNQFILALGQNKLMQCTGCYRLLYKYCDQASFV